MKMSLVKFFSSVLASSLLVSSSTFAFIPQKLESLELEYTYPKGSVTVKRADFSISDFFWKQEDLNLEILVEQNGVTLKQEKLAFGLKKIPDALNAILSVQLLDLINFNFLSLDTAFNTNFEKFEFKNTEDNHVIINDLSISAKEAADPKHKGVMGYVDAVLANSDVKVKRVYTDNPAKVAENNDGARKENVISNIHFKAAENSFVLTLNADVGIFKEMFQLAEKDQKMNLGITARGTTALDVEKGVVTMKINSVKTGLINITNRVFKELAKIDNPRIKVAQPYIYLSINPK